MTYVIISDYDLYGTYVCKLLTSQYSVPDYVKPRWNVTSIITKYYKNSTVIHYAVPNKLHKDGKRHGKSFFRHLENILRIYKQIMLSLETSLIDLWRIVNIIPNITKIVP